MNSTRLALLQAHDRAMLERQCNGMPTTIYGTRAHTGLFWLDKLNEENNKKALTKFMGSTIL